MPVKHFDIREINRLRPTDTGAVCVGRIVHINKDGRALVDFPGNVEGPIEARSIVSQWPALGNTGTDTAPVLLMFENSNPKQPVIVGFIRDAVAPPSRQAIKVSADHSGEVIVDLSTLVLEARDAVVLRCGKTSITLRRDGKVVILGAEIVSRASGTNKIKGASVKIN